MSPGSLAIGGSQPALPTFALPQGISADATDGAPPVSFQQLLTDSLRSAEAAQHRADDSVLASLAGGDITQVETLSQVKQAELMLRLTLQIRNKLLQAFSEIKELRM